MGALLQGNLQVLGLAVLAKDDGEKVLASVGLGSGELSPGGLRLVLIALFVAMWKLEGNTLAGIHRYLAVGATTSKRMAQRNTRLILTNLVKKCKKRTRTNAIENFDGHLIFTHQTRLRPRVIGAPLFKTMAN